MQNILLKSISRHPLLVKLPGHATVTTAAKMMAEHAVGAVTVMEAGRLKGIFTERDLVDRVVARGLLPDNTMLSQVMTRNPITMESTATITEALESMNRNRIRHLPIEQNGQMIGMVSIRDLLAAVNRELQDNLSTKDAFIFGEVYGMAA